MCWKSKPNSWVVQSLAYSLYRLSCPSSIFTWYEGKTLEKWVYCKTELALIFHLYPTVGQNSRCSKSWLSFQNFECMRLYQKVSLFIFYFSICTLVYIYSMLDVYFMCYVRDILSQHTDKVPDNSKICTLNKICILLVLLINKVKFIMIKVRKSWQK